MCVANCGFIQMQRAHTRSRSAAYGSLLYGSFVVRRCMSCCSIIITPLIHVFSLQSCEAWNCFDGEYKYIVSIWMLT